jgi:hypothetical protein
MGRVGHRFGHRFWAEVRETSILFYRGAVPKWPKGMVCKTITRRFESDPRLHSKTRQHRVGSRVCTAPALPSTIEMCSSLRKLFRRLVMADIERISAQQAHTKAKSNQALLVCAYEDEAKCRMVNLDGSISFASLQSRAASLPKTQEIIFY